MSQHIHPEPPAVVVLGEVLWDLVGETQRLGGAPLNFAAHSRSLGHPVMLISGLGADDLGRQAANLIGELDLDTSLLQTGSGFATGTAEVRLNPDGSAEFAIARPAAYDAIELSARELEQLRERAPAWLYFGSLFAATAQGRQLLDRVLGALGGALRLLDLKTFPNFDENLRRALRTETEMLFDSIVREDRSVIDLLDADFTFLNERLAQHYGVPGIYGSHFRRVEGIPEERRGLLGHGSVLTVTSYPNRTSPVLRGKWVMENVLGTPPPTPPPNVPALEENEPGREARSVRERLAEHRENPICASCHDVLDPIGLALENFDAVGRWRTREPGGEVDARGRLADGSEVMGPISLREAVLAKPERFVMVVTEKLMTYALGRGLEYFDMPTVRHIVREAEENDYRFSSLVLGVATSDVFRMKQIQPPAAEQELPSATSASLE